VTRERISDLEATLVAIVLSISAGGEEAFSVSIGRDLANLRDGETITAGALYTSLERLVRKGLLKAKIIPASPWRGGRGRRIYGVTSAGRLAYEAWERMVLRVLMTVKDARESHVLVVVR